MNVNEFMKESLEKNSTTTKKKNIGNTILAE
jgi:hypothetical protein